MPHLLVIDYMGFHNPGEAPLERPYDLFAQGLVISKITGAQLNHSIRVDSYRLLYEVLEVTWSIHVMVRVSELLQTASNIAVNAVCLHKTVARCEVLQNQCEV